MILGFNHDSVPITMSGWVDSKNASRSAPLATMELQFTAFFILWTCGFSFFGGALGEEAVSGDSGLVVVLGFDSRLMFCMEVISRLASLTLVACIVTQGFCPYRESVVGAFSDGWSEQMLLRSLGCHSLEMGISTCKRCRKAC